ncbi:MAG: hypothetical protein RR367_08605 [Clostridia bacterium]
MNANRMKYASTPTYGMQKRGLFKKPAAQKAPETPDFSRPPEPMPIAQPQQPFSMPPQAGYSPYPQNMPAFPSMGYFQPNAGVPPMQQAPFVPANYMQQMPPMGSPMQQPLGNSAPPINPLGGFSPRSQGYVPPAAQQSAQQPAQMQPNPAMRNPTVQSAAFAGAGMMGTSVMPYPMMPQSVMPDGGMGAPRAPFAPQSQQQPAFYAGAQGMNGVQQGMRNPQQPAYQPKTPRPARQKHEPPDADKLWSVFLFGLLPLLFIPCLFVPSALDFFRYAFLALCAVGLGGMWYRQMFSSSTRLVVSIVYVALCVVTIGLMMRGPNDVQQTNASGQAQTAVQQPSAPNDPALAAAAPTQPEPTETPAPVDDGASEAQGRLSTFMTNWAGNRVEDMVSLVQPSWASAQDNPSNRLFMLLANRTPESFTIENISGTDADNSRTVTMTANINKNNGKSATLYRFMVIMVKEGGEWYVDPNSLATNDKGTTTDGTVVNTSKVVGLATPAPRTTVSPAPPGSTTLYYNTNGGSFYHLDANCSKVRSEYLPLTGTFLYSELENDPYKKLQPCLACGAPTQPLGADGAAAAAQ